MTEGRYGSSKKKRINRETEGDAEEMKRQKRGKSKRFLIWPEQDRKDWNAV